MFEDNKRKTIEDAKVARSSKEEPRIKERFLVAAATKGIGGRHETTRGGRGKRNCNIRVTAQDLWTRQRELREDSAAAKGRR